jgi:molecular chaperone GrpE
MSHKKAKTTAEGEPPGAEVAPGREATSAASEAQMPEETLESLRLQRDDLLSRLQRVSADYLNYQKRGQRDMETARDYSNESLIRDLLPVVDDLERTMQAAAADHGEDDPFYMGVQLVHDKMLEVLKQYGVERIEAAGKPFDPAFHAALMQQESRDVAPGTVLKDYVKGFMLKGRTIRPAGVIVAKAPEPDGGDGETSTDD